MPSLVKTNISSGNLAKLGIKQCCYAPACVRGEAETGGNGRVARPAPQCGAGQRAYAARTCLAPRVRTVRKNVDKEQHQEMQLAAARHTVEKAFRPPQECRSHEAGRCYKSDQCVESHNVPYHLITVLLEAGAEAEVLQREVPHVHRAAGGQRVQVRYAHAPQAEPSQEPQGEPPLE